MKKDLRETLEELTAGILVSGFLIQAADLVISELKPQLRGTRADFAEGLWIGVAAALLMAVHMYRSIDRAFDMSSGNAERYMQRAYMLRTFAILAIVGVVYYFKLGYVMATFLGMLCLKFGAFFQPVLHRLRDKFL